MILDVFHSAYEPEPVYVATVKLDDSLEVWEALEEAWKLTQNLMGSWSQGSVIRSLTGNLVENPDFDERVTVVAELPKHKVTGETLGLRSTSMGDFIIVKGQLYRAAMFGFEKE